VPENRNVEDEATQRIINEEAERRSPPTLRVWGHCWATGEV